ncbi:hypothetical protein S101258_00209 [Lactiplantibacillus plantarum subsp. plantarum]|uniref:6-phospho-N-acetylmuramidase C-terminal domain-containing protein n=1 Tax=Lactiplantibacillus plantarum subsp. plantarum TaxID=337330 RepID=A0A2S3U9M4_LACPN|nr:hypothetical protein S101258_00209 [Lactiplantibacillus plantarum subsp. plantarum]
MSSDWHNRPDVARDVVRLVEGSVSDSQLYRRLQTASRPRGAITIDNECYGRLRLENSKIVKEDISCGSTKSMLFGWVVPSDLAFITVDWKVKLSNSVYIKKDEVSWI